MRTNMKNTRMENTEKEVAIGDLEKKDLNGDRRELWF